MKAYYAHCIAIYNTPQERRDIETLAAIGFQIENPNSKECEDGYRANGMGYFQRFANECDLIAFRALPDGSIPAGVAAEIDMFRRAGKPAIELPSQIARRTLNVEQTREYLNEIGNR